MDSRYFRLAGLLFMIQLAIHHTKAFEIEHIYAHEIKNAQLSYVAIVDDKDDDHNNSAEELNGADAENALSGLDNNSVLGGINDKNSVKHANEKPAIVKPHAPSRKIIGTKVNPLVNEESDMNELVDSNHGQDPKKETGKENTLGTHHNHGELWDEPVQGGAHKTGRVMESKQKPSVQVAQPKAGMLETKPKQVTREQEPTDINNEIQKGQDKQNSMGEYKHDYPHQDADKLRKYLSFNNGLSQDEFGDTDENKTDIFGHTVAHGNADNSVHTDAHKNENGVEKENTLGSDRQPSGDCGPNKVHLDGGLSQNGLHNIAKSNKAELNVNQENASKPLTIFESNKNLGVQKDIGNKLTNVETYVFFPNLQRRAELDCNTTTTPCTTTTTLPPTTPCETTTTPCPTTTTPCPTTTTTCETTTTPCTTTTTAAPTTAAC
uniref:Uncharacterized protein n=1 Tax=Cacopsylla melanoneura TaxID=428564 RepID=A0A8D8T8C6_9HEMI